MKQRSRLIFWIAGPVMLVLMAAADLLCGDAAAGAEVIGLLRAPRTVTAVLAGAALAASGAQMQSIFRNPLADPHIMGISSGAALGAAAATMLGGKALMGIALASAAFGGAMLSAILILLFSGKFRSAGTLLIFGVMLGFIVNALTSILQFSSDAESLKIFYSWSAGSFSNSTWPQIAVMAAALTAGTSIALLSHKNLDIILFGDEFATMSGADTGRIRLCALLSSCIMTGAVTAFCGPLGFVGIVAPHIARSLCRTSSHKVIIPASLMTGACIGLGSDLISQLSPSPLPVASTMAIIGIPFIFYILIKKPAL